MSVLRASQSWKGKGHQQVLTEHQYKEQGSVGGSFTKRRNEDRALVYA